VRRLRITVPLTAIAVVLTAGAATPSSPARPALVAKEPSAVLGISTRRPAGTLAWFQRLTLQPLSGRKVPLAFHTGSYAFSSDRATLAVAECIDSGVASIRFVNARAMRVLGDLRLSNSMDCASSLTWLRPNRLLAVLTRSNSSDAEVVVVDPTKRRVLRHMSLPAAPWTTSSTGQELVLLLGSYDSFAPARVVIVSADGNVRTAVVENVLIGTVVDESSQDYRARTISPGFAVDPEGRRAFLVPASGPIAEIDLQTLSVSLHDLGSPSLVRRFLRWLTPSAEAKAIEGPVREARWLGDGVLAVSGFDYSIAGDSKETEHVVAKPAGVKLVDTRSWHTRMLRDGSGDFAVTPGLVIAQGGAWDEGSQVTSSPGLLAFGLDGKERWGLHQGEDRRIEPDGPVGYVWVAQGSMEVVDLSSGHVLATLRRNESRNPWPWLLAAQSSG